MLRLLMVETFPGLNEYPIEELAKFKGWNVKEAEQVSITVIGLEPL